MTAYDFLREGTSSYKQSFATSANQLVELNVCRPSLNVFVLGVAQVAARGIRKLSHALRSGEMPKMRNRAERANPQHPTTDAAD